MKVVHYCDNLGLGCTAKTAVNFVVHLSKSGYDVEFWCQNIGPRSEELESNNIKYKVLTDSSITASLYKGVDVIHIHSSGQNNEFLFNLISCKPSQTFVVQTNVFGGYSSILNSFIDLNLFVSEATLVKYHLFGGSLSKSYEVLYNPVQKDIDFEIKAEKNSSKIVIGRIARPDLLKWDNEFLELLVKLKAARLNFKLIIVGVPHIVKKEIENLNIDVDFIDSLYGEIEIEEFYKSLDVLLHLSSIGESFGCVFVEAMNYGVPVIVKSTNLNKFQFWRDNAQVEVVKNGVTGYVCCNILDMRDAILSLVLNRFDNNQIIIHNKNMFSSEMIYMRLTQIYEELVSGNHKSIEINEYLVRHRQREMNIYKPIFFSFVHKFNYFKELGFVRCKWFFNKIKWN